MASKTNQETPLTDHQPTSHTSTPPTTKSIVIYTRISSCITTPKQTTSISSHNASSDSQKDSAQTRFSAPTKEIKTSSGVVTTPIINITPPLVPKTSTNLSDSSTYQTPPQTPAVPHTTNQVASHSKNPSPNRPSQTASTLNPYKQSKLPTYQFQPSPKPPSQRIHKSAKTSWFLPNWELSAAEESPLSMLGGTQKQRPVMRRTTSEAGNKHDPEPVYHFDFRLNEHPCGKHPGFFDKVASFSEEHKKMSVEVDKSKKVAFDKKSSTSSLCSKCRLPINNDKPSNDKLSKICKCEDASRKVEVAELKKKMSKDTLEPPKVIFHAGSMTTIESSASDTNERSAELKVLESLEQKKMPDAEIIIENDFTIEMNQLGGNEEERFEDYLESTNDGDEGEIMSIIWSSQVWRHNSHELYQ